MSDTADVAPSLGMEFLAESEAEAGQSELPLGGGEDNDLLQDIAQSVPRKVQPPPQAPKPYGKQPPPQKAPGGLERNGQQPQRQAPPPKPAFEPIELEVGGRKYIAKTREEAQAMLARGLSLQQKADQIQRQQQQMEEDRRLMRENPKAWFLRQNSQDADGARRAAYALLEDQAMYEEYQKQDAIDGGQRAKAFALEKRAEYQQQAEQLQRQQQEQARIEQETAKEAEAIENQFVEAIEKHGYPRSPIAIKIMANVLRDCENEDYRPDTSSLVRESYRMLAELQGQHFESMGPKNILQGISPRHLEWIRQGLIARAKPQRAQAQSRNPQPRPNSQRRASQDPYGETKEDFDKAIRQLTQGYSKTYGG